MKNTLIPVILFIIVGLAVVFIANNLIFSGPDPTRVAELAMINNSVKNIYGEIEKVEVLPLPGSEKNWSGEGLSSVGVWPGTLFFRVKGTKSTGIIKVEWQEKNPTQISLLKISEIGSSDADAVLWEKEKETSTINDAK